MIADRTGQVRVRAGFDGTIEFRVAVGDIVYPGRALVIVESDSEVETFSARNPGVVRELCAPDGTDVVKGALLLLVDETPAE